MEARATIDPPSPANGYGAAHGRWRLFCSHGTILFYVARHPGCTIQEIADALALTPRTVWGLIGDLRHARLITVHREGRRHHYRVDQEGKFPDPILSHLTLGEAMRAIEGHVPPVHIAKEMRQEASQMWDRPADVTPAPTNVFRRSG